MKIHFIVPAAFVRLSGNDVKSRYVFLRFSRLWNERKCAFCTLPLIIFSAIKSNLNGIEFALTSFVQLRRWGLRGSA